MVLKAAEMTKRLKLDILLMIYCHDKFVDQRGEDNFNGVRLGAGTLVWI